MVYGVVLALLTALVFAAFLPRAGLVVGPMLIVIGVIPIALLYFVPAASRPRVEEHYGLLATIAFVVASPTGLLMTVLSAILYRR